MSLFAVIFYILAAVILAATAMAVTRRDPVHAVVYLVGSFFGSAMLFFLLGAPFLAALEVIIYAGAIMILFLFIIMKRIGYVAVGVIVIFALVLSLLVRMLGYGTFLHQIITTGIFINLLFAVFNLIPIPPLDGSRVVMGLLPPDLAYEYSKLEQFGFIILILLLVLGLIHKIVLPIVIGIARLMGVGL